MMTSIFDECMLKAHEKVKEIENEKVIRENIEDAVLAHYKVIAEQPELDLCRLGDEKEEKLPTIEIHKKGNDENKFCIVLCSMDDPLDKNGLPGIYKAVDLDEFKKYLESLKVKHLKIILKSLLRVPEYE